MTVQLGKTGERSNTQFAPLAALVAYLSLEPRAAAEL